MPETGSTHVTTVLFKNAIVLNLIFAVDAEPEHFEPKIPP
jgi:hypothetical protein